jgi:hypothetical protein
MTSAIETGLRPAERITAKSLTDIGKRATCLYSRLVGQLIFSFSPCQEAKTLIVVDWGDKVGIRNRKRARVLRSAKSDVND